MLQPLQLHAVTRDIPMIADQALVAHIGALLPYVDAIQLREKSRSPKALALLIERLLQADVPADKLIINDRADIALAFGIQKVHLTEQSLPLSRLEAAFPTLQWGRSFHSVNAVEKQLSHYDYGYLGHIFPTEAKEYTPLGVDYLQLAYEAINAECRLNGGNNASDGKLIAIGGINLGNVESLFPFVDGIALMSTLFPLRDHRLDTDQAVRQAAQFQQILTKKE